MAKSLEGYYEGEGKDLLDAIDEIVRKIEKKVNSPALLRYVDVSDYEFGRDDGKPLIEEQVRQQGKGNFYFTICLFGYGCYFAGGTALKKGKKWVAGAEVEVAEYA